MPDGTGVLGFELLIMAYNGGWSAQYAFPLMAPQGSVVSTADRTGFIMPFMTCSPWGELGRVDATQPYTARPQGSPFGYTGREYDAETGLWRYRARYYQPRLGQFLSTDPIGMEDRSQSVYVCGPGSGEPDRSHRDADGLRGSAATSRSGT